MPEVLHLGPRYLGQVTRARTQSGVDGYSQDHVGVHRLKSNGLWETQSRNQHDAARAMTRRIFDLSGIDIEQRQRI